MFLGCAAAFRAARAKARPEVAELATKAHHSLERAPTCTARLHRVSRGVVDLLDAAVDDVVKLDRPYMARRFDVSIWTVSRQLHANTGIKFTAWRRGALGRLAIRLLGDPDSQIKLLTVSLGYKHGGQFDRDIEYLFGVAPSTLRATLVTRTR